MTRIELPEEERAALLRLVEEALRGSKYLLAPATEVLREIAEKLRGDLNLKPSRR